MSRATSKQPPHRILPRIPVQTAPEVADPIELSVSELMAKGRQRGFLTWEELNDALPDEAVMPDRLEGILQRLEEFGVDMVDEAEAAKLPYGEESPAANKRRLTPEQAAATEETFPVDRRRPGFNRHHLCWQLC